MFRKNDVSDLRITNLRSRLWEIKPSFIKIALLNKISRNWPGNKKKLFEKEHETEQGRIETVEYLESTQTQLKLRRSSISLKNFTPTWFFSDQDDSDMKLNMRQTFQVQRNIEAIAQEIGDTKVLAKLSVGDMIAIAAKYHRKCLAAYYNKVRNEQPTSGM